MPACVAFFLFLAGCIVVHQAAVDQNFTLILGEIGEVQMQVFYLAASDDLGIDFLLAVDDGLAQAGHIDEVASLVVKLGLGIDGERHNATVDAVAAVALGGILIADVGIDANNILARFVLLASLSLAELL